MTRRKPKKNSISEKSENNKMSPGEFLNRCCNSKVNSLFKRSDILSYEEIYDNLKFDLEELLRNYYDNVEVHFFGSRLMGLADDKSNLDIFVEIGNFINE